MRPARDLTELSKVRALTKVSDAYHEVAAGALGTIVHVYAAGEAFEVEFDPPEHAVLLAKRDQIEAA